MYLVDTNIVAAARRGAIEAVRWLRSVNPNHVHLSVVTLGEIMHGVASSRSPTRAPRRNSANGCTSSEPITPTAFCRSPPRSPSNGGGSPHCGRAARPTA